VAVDDREGAVGVPATPLKGWMETILEPVPVQRLSVRDRAGWAARARVDVTSTIAASSQVAKPGTCS